MRTLLGQGARLVDVRPVTEFAAGHIPGAVSIALRNAFATWLGWLLPPDVPLVFVLGPGQDSAEVAWQAAKVGYDRLAGQLAGGMDTWRDDGGPVAVIETMSAGGIGDLPVIDVRQDTEYVAGHIPGAVHVELGTLRERTPVTAEGAVVMCGQGVRAMTAASLLAAADARRPAVLIGGADDWARGTGHALQVGV
ncbi:rhodanese-like domain-containing protein [Streptomyces sp. T028]|uniref:rhodanese-like domain-containing protein n=1 Tax=Streptomyces sp. T028 TaxID=3394379 RepID=UPI003A8384C5